MRIEFDFRQVRLQLVAWRRTLSPDRRTARRLAEAYLSALK